MKKKYENLIRLDFRYLLDYCDTTYRDNVLFMFKDKHTVKKTYHDFHNDVKSLATLLNYWGYNRSKIGIIGDNSYMWILSYFSIINSNNIVVPLDKELTSSEISGLVDESDCEVIFISKKQLNAQKELIKREKNIKFLYLDNDENDCNSIPQLLNTGQRLIENGFSVYETLEFKPHQLVAIHYTSGTTGLSKGVMLSAENILSNACSVNEFGKIIGNTVLVLPMNHTFAITNCILCSMMYGNTIFINTNLRRLIQDIKEQRPNYLFLVPLFVEKIYEKIWSTASKNNVALLMKCLIKISNILLRFNIDLRGYFFKGIIDQFGGRLKYILCGGAYLDPLYCEAFNDFGISVFNGYGITECSPAISGNFVNKQRIGSVGKIMSCCDVRIYNPDEKGEGEIQVRGDNVMLGYYKNPQATKDAFCQGWFRTGDIGSIKDDYLYITGREKNIIIMSNGKNIYPEEIEIKLRHISYVKEAIVYGEETTSNGNNVIKIIAEVFIEDDKKDLHTELEKDIQKINKSLPFYKRINEIVIRKTEFDKTTTKKIKRGKD